MPSLTACPTCRHTHTTGLQCGSPALRGEQFCYFHHPTRRPARSTSSRSVAFEVPPITDNENLQIALCEILRRVADNTLDTKRGGLLLHTLEMASANLIAWAATRQNYGRQSGPCQTNPDSLAD